MQSLKPMPLQLRIVVVIEAINTDDRLPSREGLVGDMRANEPGNACDQDRLHTPSVRGLGV